MNDQEWKEAKAPQYPSVRWTEAAEVGKEETTVYLGPVVQGLFIDQKDGLGANDSSIYHIQLADGRIVGVWSTTVLKDRMKMVPMGSEVRLTLNGSKKAKVAGRKNWLDITVQFAKPVTQMHTVGETPVSPSNPSTTGGTPPGVNLDNI